MDRPDFYINLLYFVKRMAIDSKEINDFIESVFISR